MRKVSSLLVLLVFIIGALLFGVTLLNAEPMRAPLGAYSPIDPPPVRTVSPKAHKQAKAHHRRKRAGKRGKFTPINKIPHRKAEAAAEAQRQD